MSPNTTSRKVYYLIRHGATRWSDEGRHTGRTDLALEAHGVEQAHHLSDRLKGIRFAHIFSSPLKRTVETCRLCSLTPTLDSDLLEWDYGDYEGKTSSEIGPHWNLWRDGAPGGETVSDVRSRAKHFLQQTASLEAPIAVFSSAHILRMIAILWLELDPSAGEKLFLSPASLSILGFEREHRVIICWNDIAHLRIV